MENGLIRNRLAFLTLVTAAGLLLAACSGSAPSASWPGLAADAGHAYVAYNQQVHAVDLTTHLQTWAFPVKADNNVGLLYAPPGVSGDIIVVGSEGPTNSYSGVLYGLKSADGTQVWCLAFDQKGGTRQNCPVAGGAATGGLFGITAPSDNRVIGGIALADGTAYFGLASGAVFAVNAANGQMLWRFNAERAVWAAPVVSDGMVFIASLDHRLYALNRADGKLAWSKDLASAVAGTPAYANGTLYVGTFGSQLVALDAASGKEKWTFTANNWVWGGPVLADSTLYFGDLSGTVFALDAGDGTKKWAVTPGGVMTASPAVTADAVYVADRLGKLFALDPATGATKTGWPVEVGGELLTTPLVAGDALLIASHKGANLITAYGANGALQWPFAPSK
jgi:outer membrane protein assembly factor BamB